MACHIVFRMSSTEHIQVGLPRDLAIRSPNDFLKRVIGETVLVRLNSGSEYCGKLVCLDGYMNIVLTQVEERCHGQVSRKYKDATFIRGNNGKYTGEFINNIERLFSFVYKSYLE